MDVLSLGRDKDRPWKCDACWVRFEAEFDLHEHIVSEHGESRCCTICGVELVEKTMEQHLVAMHDYMPYNLDIQGAPRKSKVADNLLCPYCSKWVVRRRIDCHLAEHESQSTSTALPGQDGVCHCRACGLHVRWNEINTHFWEHFEESFQSARHHGARHGSSSTEDESLSSQDLAGPLVKLKDKQALLGRLASLFNDPEISDVTLVATDGRELYCHYVVISIFSEPLKRMFELQMIERSTQTATLEDVDPDALESMVRFMYTGECIIDSENIIPIMAAADRFEVQSLLQLCQLHEKALLSVNSHNCFVLLEKAFEHHMSEVVVEASRFIMNNVSHDHENWKDLSCGAFKALINQGKNLCTRSQFSFVRGASTWVEANCSERWSHGVVVLHQCNFNTLSLKELANVGNLNIIQTDPTLKDLVFKTICSKGMDDNFF